MKKYLLLVLCSSCALGPNFCRPDVPTPCEWQGEEVVDISHEPWVEWWNIFQDPLLTELIEEAVCCSIDSKIAETRVRRARAERKRALSAQWPHLGLDFDASRLHLSDEFPFLTQSQGFNIFDASFDASWEVDIFGKAKRGREAVDAAVAAEIEKKHLTTLTLIAEVARNYFDLRHLQEQALVVQEILDTQHLMLNLAQMQEHEQLASPLVVLEIKQHLFATEEKLSTLQAGSFLIRNRIAFLINGLPGSLDDKLMAYAPLPSLPEYLPIGLPSSLLCRRPDVRAVEALYALRTAQVGLSLSDFMPKFDLLANVGYLSTKIAQLFQDKTYNAFYNFFSNWPIFEGGGLLAQLRIAQADQREALLTYAKVALYAFHDVDYSLALYKEKKEHLTQAQHSVDNSFKLLETKKALYSEQLASKQLVAEGTLALLSQKSHLLENQSALLEQYIALYKALGGGWEAFDD